MPNYSKRKPVSMGKLLLQRLLENHPSYFCINSEKFILSTLKNKCKYFKNSLPKAQKADPFLTSKPLEMGLW